MNIMIGHPKLVTFGIGLAITFVVGTVIGMLDHGQMAFAARDKVPVVVVDDDKRKTN